jgi:hypothetical protein
VESRPAAVRMLISDALSIRISHRPGGRGRPLTLHLVARRWLHVAAEPGDYSLESVAAGAAEGPIRNFPAPPDVSVQLEPQSTLHAIIVRLGAGDELLVESPPDAYAARAVDASRIDSNARSVPRVSQSTSGIIPPTGGAFSRMLQRRRK